MPEESTQRIGNANALPLKPGENQAIIDAIKSLTTPITVSTEVPGAGPIQLAFSPNGLSLVDLQVVLDKYRDHPRFRIGTAVAMTLDSFMEYTRAFHDDDTMVFFNPDKNQPRVLSILDYHQKGSYRSAEPSHCRHQVMHSFGLDPSWVAWNGIDGKTLKVEEFARFLDNRYADVIDAPLTADGDAGFSEILRGLPGVRFGTQMDMVRMARGLQLNEEHRVTNLVNLDTGETQIAFENTQKPDEAGDTLKVPNAYLLQMRVFDREEHPWRIAARFRFRKVQASVNYTIQLYRPERTFQAALDDAKERLTSAGFKTIYGWPVPLNG